ncbi:hypothetical protein GOV11_01075 [Candidatus Woesearchaeota archaeon]|nr:hypothetical protein [Candidatus Woesearchaeota archaeon]
MKTRLYSPDIECDSCVKVLNRMLKKERGITDFKITTEYIDLSYDKKLKLKLLMKRIKEKGYRVSSRPMDRPQIRERIGEFLTDRKKYMIEWRMLKYMTVTLIFALVLQGAFAYMMDGLRPGFMAAYWPWLTYLTFSTVFISAAVWHFLAYRTTVTCMTGMMIGMTIGMQTGMLVGAVLGVTNGFFWGAMVGMLSGSIIGAWTGNCCGIMGIMEGLMSGIMGGTMGAMITVMMVFDHIHWFMPVYVFLNLLILVGFSYMLFEELVEGKDVAVKPASFPAFLAACLGALALLTALVVFLPKSTFLGV